MVAANVEKCSVHKLEMHFQWVSQHLEESNFRKQEIQMRRHTNAKDLA